MSYIEEQLESGEHVVYRARVRLLAYLYAVAAFALVMTPGPFSALASTELALTDKRVIGRVGTLNRKTIALPYAQIETVKVRQSLLGMLFDYGYLAISGADGSKITFKGIIEPLDIKIQIDEAVEMAVLGRKLSQIGVENEPLFPKGA